MEPTKPEGQGIPIGVVDAMVLRIREDGGVRSRAALQEELYGKVRAILGAPDVKTARLLMERVVDNYSDKARKAVDILESAF